MKSKCNSKNFLYFVAGCGQHVGQEGGRQWTTERCFFAFARTVVGEGFSFTEEAWRDALRGGVHESKRTVIILDLQSVVRADEPCLRAFPGLSVTDLFCPA